MRDNLELLNELGGLHDARVEEVVWRKADHSLRFTIEDMFSNFDGLPDYPGPTPGTLTLVGVENATIEAGVFKGQFIISGVDVEQRDGGFGVRLGLREPGADIRLRCRDLEITLTGRKT